MPSTLLGLGDFVMDEKSKTPQLRSLHSSGRDLNKKMNVRGMYVYTPVYLWERCVL